MEVDSGATRPKKQTKPVEIVAIREAFKQRMENKKKKMHKPVKISTK